MNDTNDEFMGYNDDERELMISTEYELMNDIEPGPNRDWLDGIRRDRPTVWRRWMERLSGVDRRRRPTIGPEGHQGRRDLILKFPGAAKRQRRTAVKKGQS